MLTVAPRGKTKPEVSSLIPPPRADSKVTGSVADDDAVANAVNNALRTEPTYPNKGRFENNLKMKGRTTTAWSKSPPSTTSTNFQKGAKMEKPKVPMSGASKPITPIGATRIIPRVSVKNTSLSDMRTETSGFPRSPVNRSETPTAIAKRIIPKIFISANAVKILSGTSRVRNPSSESIASTSG